MFSNTNPQSTGIDGLQIYPSAGLGVTWIHDEIGWISALNYMMRHSDDALASLLLSLELDEDRELVNRVQTDMLKGVSTPELSKSTESYTLLLKDILLAHGEMKPYPQSSFIGYIHDRFPQAYVIASNTTRALD